MPFSPAKGGQKQEETMKLFKCKRCGMIKEFENKPVRDSVIRCPVCGERCWEEIKKEKKNNAGN